MYAGPSAKRLVVGCEVEWGVKGVDENMPWPPVRFFPGMAHIASQTVLGRTEPQRPQW